MEQKYKQGEVIGVSKGKSIEVVHGTGSVSEMGDMVMYLAKECNEKGISATFNMFYINPPKSEYVIILCREEAHQLIGTSDSYQSIQGVSSF